MAPVATVATSIDGAKISRIIKHTTATTSMFAPANNLIHAAAAAQSQSSASPAVASLSNVTLNESAQSNVYFMMQTPIELLASTATVSAKRALSPPLPPPVSVEASSSSTASSSNVVQLLAAAPSSPSLNSLQLTSTLPMSAVGVAGGGGSGGKVVRDDRRRANHNEVERRRRDNINKWIVELSKVIPDCNDQSKHGQVGAEERVS